jgi:hypothetical protein
MDRPCPRSPDRCSYACEGVDTEMSSTAPRPIHSIERFLSDLAREVSSLTDDP